MMNLLVSVAFLLCMAVATSLVEADPQYLGFGGVQGSLSPRTGSVWPPFQGAGQGYWARRAGVYAGRNKRSAQYLG